jgi:SpoVK/Ycf46/Vps4 family AAA+-type ATPase
MTNNKGILAHHKLPHPDYDALWDRIIVPSAQKEQLIAQILLEYTVRKEIERGALPLHGLILLSGPPGTGKTTLAKAAASKAAHFFKGKHLQFIEVEPHGLTSSSLGKSQREMHKFLNETIAEYAAQAPTIVLLDEVETLAVDRQKLSLEANPIDVHRATDAVLASLDHLAEAYPDLLFIATSNFETAVDTALLSRADLILHIDKPTPEACAAILRDTLEIMGRKWKKLGKLADDTHMKDAAKAAHGLDGRQIRKAVIQACATSKETAQNPDLLTIETLIGALKAAKKTTT